MPVKLLKWPIKRAIEATIFTALPYDCYLVDQIDTIPAFAQMQLYYAAQQRNAGLLFSSGAIALARQIRDSTIAISAGTVSYMETETHARCSHVR
jgi:hypothetical protein